MRAARTAQARPANQLLASLPQTEYTRLLSSLIHVNLKKKTVLYHIGDTVQYCYFPVSGIVSLLSTAAEGKTVEVGMCGNEGMIGVSVLLQTGVTPYDLMVQTETDALQIDARVLKAEFNRGGKLNALLLRYIYALICQISQSAVCHHFHTVEQRLARWLLMTRDRLQSNTVPLTQEFLAYMLGIPRTNLTMTAGALQSAGLINYRRGIIIITDEKGLEETALTNSNGTTSDTWNVVETKYDLLGRIWKTSNPFRSNLSQTGTDWTVNEYDAAGRLASVTSPDGSISKNFYNETARPTGIGVSTALGKTLRAVDPVGREKWALFDIDENLVEVVEPNPDGDGKVTNNGLLTTYQYDRLSQLKQINQGAQLRRFHYDGLGRLTHEKMAEQDATLNDDGTLAVSAPGMWSTVYKYDDRSNLASQTDARGVNTSFFYQPDGSPTGQLDALNRLFSVIYETNGAQNVLPSPTVKYAYDPAKPLRMTSVTTTGVSTESFGYDSQGRVASKETVLVERPSKPLEVRYLYDTLNRPTDVYYPKQYGNGTEAQKNLHYDYKTGSKLDNLKVDNVLYASNTAFNVNDQLTSIKIGPSGVNQITETYDFNPKNGLLNNQKVTRASTVLMDLTYNYQFQDGVTGQLRGIINNLDRNKDRAYEYDALGRLKKVIGGINQGWSQTYVYDRYGNRKNVITSGFESLRTRGDVKIDDKQISNKGDVSSAAVGPVNSSQLIEKVNSLAKTKEIRQAIDPKRSAVAPQTEQAEDFRKPSAEPSQTGAALQNGGVKQDSAQGGLNERLSNPPAKTPFDFDGDGKADISTWGRNNGNWVSKRSAGGQTTVQLGASGNQIAPGDYDGDGKTDEAVWNPANGVWTIKRSSTGVVYSQAWGMSGDAIVPADYDADGKTDIAVWRPSTGYWYALRSSDGSLFASEWGHQRFGDIAVIGDYDGDGKADTAVWRPSNGNWYVLVLQSGSGQILDVHWGATGDVPVPADYDGDNKTDVAVWRPSTGYWYISRSSDNQFVPIQLGEESQRDIMVPADYDGDRKADVAIWRPSTGTWTIKQSTTNTNITHQLGTTGDVAVPSAYIRRSSAPRGQSVEIPRDGWESISYDPLSNRITASSGYWYDATGNQTRAKKANGLWMRFQYDAAGRLVKVKDDNDQSILTYTYGSTRERLIAQEGNESSIVKTYYVWQDGAVIAEFSNSAANNSIVWGKNYIYLGGRLLATQTSLGTGEAVEFSHPDLLGTRLVSNAAQGTAFEQANLPFGVALQSESTIGETNRRFTSYDRSNTTGIDYAVNRFYDPMQGRFTQADPIGMEATSLEDPQSLNLFAYVNNDPVNKVDPSGLWGFSISFGGGDRTRATTPTVMGGGWLGGGNSLINGLFNFFYGMFQFIFGSPNNIPVSNLLARTPLNYASFTSNTTTASSAPSTPPAPGFENMAYGALSASTTASNGTGWGRVIFHKRNRDKYIRWSRITQNGVTYETPRVDAGIVSDVTTAVVVYSPVRMGAEGNLPANATALPMWFRPDHRGHIISRALGGLDADENLFSQNGSINSGRFERFERKIRQVLTNHKKWKAVIKVRLLYNKPAETEEEAIGNPRRYFRPISVIYTVRFFDKGGTRLRRQYRRVFPN